MPSADGTLVLEVGGGHTSLRASLLAAGVSVAAPHALRPPTVTSASAVAPSADVATGEGPGSGRARHGGQDPRRLPEDAPAVPHGAELEPSADTVQWTTVVLGKGGTLIHLAKRHLGDGRRFPELLQWNGWSDADARRLRAGQVVRIPVTATAPR